MAASGGRYRGCSVFILAGLRSAADMPDSISDAMGIVAPVLASRFYPLEPNYSPLLRSDYLPKAPPARFISQMRPMWRKSKRECWTFSTSGTSRRFAVYGYLALLTWLCDQGLHTDGFEAEVRQSREERATADDFKKKVLMAGDLGDVVQRLFDLNVDAAQLTLVQLNANCIAVFSYSSFPFKSNESLEDWCTMSPAGYEHLLVLPRSKAVTCVGYLKEQKRHGEELGTRSRECAGTTGSRMLGSQPFKPKLRHLRLS